ncbi:MAG TPA: tetratricopeptide repeat protein, partial [Chthoniobacterales bacterium]|nr:tetratricopeptide repeat protein [Chthoniobacterales bacterium]
MKSSGTIFVLGFLAVAEALAQDANEFYNRGVLDTMNNRLEEAIANFDRAVALNPKFADAYINRGMVWEEKNDAGRAVVDFTHAIEIDSKDAGAYNCRG